MRSIVAAMDIFIIVIKTKILNQLDEIRNTNTKFRSGKVNDDAFPITPVIPLNSSCTP
jgi:hypothetical protein